MKRDVDFTSVVDFFSIVYSQCINRYCKEVDPFKPVVHNMSDTLVQALAGQTVITATECAANREGLLCGQCKPGYALTMYYKVRGHTRMRTFEFKNMQSRIHTGLWKRLQTSCFIGTLSSCDEKPRLHFQLSHLLGYGQFKLSDMTGATPKTFFKKENKS